MTKLKEIKNEIFDYCNSKFTIFESRYPLEQIPDSSIEFKLEDWREFIDIAKILNINILYYYQDSDVDTHPNEIGLIQIGFFYGKVFHSYLKSEEWYTKLMSNEEDHDKEEILKIIKASATEILEEILNFLEETGRAISSYGIDPLLDDYFLCRYNFRYRSINDNYYFKSIKLSFDEAKEFRAKMEQVIKLLEEKRDELQRKKIEDDLKNDDEVLKIILPECVEWARSNSLPKLNKSNVYQFCILKNAKLSDTGIDRLYIMVNKELKKRDSD